MLVGPVFFYPKNVTMITCTFLRPITINFFIPATDSLDPWMVLRVLSWSKVKLGWNTDNVSGVTSFCWVIFDESSLPRIVLSKLYFFYPRFPLAHSNRKRRFSIKKIRLTLIWFLWLRMRYLKSGLNKHKSKFNTANGTKHGSRGQSSKCKSGCPELRVGLLLGYFF